MTRTQWFKLPEYAVSDEAAAYIADALMEIALQFETTHFDQNPPSLLLPQARTRRQPWPTTRSVRATPAILRRRASPQYNAPSFLAFFCSTAPQAFFRPDRRSLTPSRAGAVNGRPSLRQ